LSSIIVTMNPLDNHTSYWVLHGGERGADFEGKWMLYYKVSELPAAWLKATELYDANQLPGVVAMKCSTARDNERASSPHTKVIIFYCGGSEESIMCTGRVLVSAMEYQPPSGHFVYYKTDLQTLEGTGATGAKKNHKYKIAVERNDTEDNEDTLPMQTMTEHQLVVTSKEYQNRISGLPAVRLNFHPASLDDNWMRAKDLFRANSLPGCVGLKTETVLASPRKGSTYKQMQFIYGGDIECMEEVTEFVKIVIKHLGSECEDEAVGIYKFRGRKPVLSLPLSKYND